MSADASLDLPDLPPLFAARPLAPDADAAAVARARIDAGAAEAGDLFFAVRPDRLDMALVLTPETPLRHSAQVIYVAMCALNDAVGSAIPAQIGLTYAWPGRILINGAEAGRLAYTTDGETAGDIPSWLLVSGTLDLMGDPGADPGLETRRTTLYEEGAAETGPKDILEPFARYFMNWLHRWETEGLERLRPAWETRMAGVEAPVLMPRDGLWIEATALGLDEEGNMRMRVGDAADETLLPLLDAFAPPEGP